MSTTQPYILKHFLKNMLNKYLLKISPTSGQDGGVGKHGSPPYTATAKITAMLQNRNLQKLKLYGNPTTKGLQKSCSFRWVGGVEMQRHGMDGPTPTCGG